MFKKKMLFFSIVVVLIFSLVLVGCGGGNDYEVPEEFEDEQIEETPTEETPPLEDGAPTPPPTTPSEGSDF